MKEKNITIRAALAIVILLQIVLSNYIFVAKYDVFDLEKNTSGVSIFAAAEKLTREIPDSEQVVAFDTSAWPVVALGQRVLSVPWPEPGIHDLAERQATTKLLFDVRLSREERLEIARRAKVRTLIIDERLLPAQSLKLLLEQSVRSEAAGTLLRLNLVDLGYSSASGQR